MVVSIIPTRKHSDLRSSAFRHLWRKSLKSLSDVLFVQFSMVSLLVKEKVLHNWDPQLRDFDIVIAFYE